MPMTLRTEEAQVSMKKLMTTCFVVLVAVAAVVAVGKNVFAKTVLENGIRSATGFPLRMQQLHVGVISTSIGVTGLEIHNPPGYVDRVFLSAPEIYIDYDARAFLRREWHLENVRIDVQELVVVRNANGQLNVDQLQSIKRTQAAREKHTPPPSRESRIRIDRLELTLPRQIVFKDYSGGGEPKISQYPIGVNHEVFYDITDLSTVVNLVVAKALVHTALARLITLPIDALDTTLGTAWRGGEGLLMGTKKTVSEALSKTGEVLRGVGEKIGGALGQLTTDGDE